jgi:hypothetical protein
MSWHVDQDVLRRYQTGGIERATAASLEAHITACADCRADLMVDSDWLKQSWTGIADRVEPAEPTVVERVLGWLGVPSHVARVMSVTPSLRPSWLIAVTLTLVFAGFVSQVAPPGSFDLFLAIAPLVPVAGVAVAYGRAGDPAHEITAATPIDTLRLLLLRAAAVTGFALVLSLVLDVAFFSERGTGLWILPALALTSTTLALGTHMTMWLSGAFSAGAWVALLSLFLARPQGRLTPVFDVSAQVMFVIVAAVAVLVFVHERDVYRRGEER